MFEGQNKKRLYLIGGILVAVAVVCLGIMFFINFQKSQKLQNAKAAYNKYANYILTGEAKAGDVSAKQENAEYLIESMTFPYENLKDTSDIVVVRNPEFVSTAKKLFADIKDDYTGETVDLAIQEDGLAILEAYVSTYLTRDEVLQYGLKNGSDAAHDYIDENFAVATNSNNSKIKNYAANKTSELNDWIDLAARYHKVGCIKAKKVDNTCAAEKFFEIFDGSVSSINDINVYATQASEIINATTKGMVNDCYELGGKLGVDFVYQEENNE